MLITGYQIKEKIYSGNKSLVYRAIREKDQTPVVIKLMRNQYPSFSDIAQFRNQYSITKHLDIDGIVKIHSIESYQNSYALVIEDFGGISLKKEIETWENEKIRSNPHFIGHFIEIAIQIASILDLIHKNRIIHKDIKPANILIKPSTGEVRIIDFSIASLLPREVQVLSNPNILEGTLAYISPEQTGRMNRGIDYRSDFYCLGVTFFELLTGQLPFTTTDSMELVHCHIAKKPPTASNINSNIPAILSDIVSKLMAKNAEERYQSSLGLKHDLQLCLQQWQERGNITCFELGTQDIYDRFVISEKLYGREIEIHNLLAAFERVSQGNSEMILVAGYSGIGKTAVVNEVHKPMVQRHSYFIKGKFDQVQRDVPFSGFVQAFSDLIAQLLSESDAQIQQWKNRVLQALGEQAQVIIDIIPDLELIIGKQPEITQLSGNAAQNRFNLLFQKFIQIFATKDHPLVIFLDDLQWADAASLKFIELLMSPNQSNFSGEEGENTEETQQGLLLIGAYRDNEVSKTHPLYLTLKDIEQTQAIINTITLEPLTQGELNFLIADTLHCQEQIAVPLNQLVFAKTKGNPFFATQFLKSLHNDGLIKFNFEVRYWEYDLEKIKASALTDDVVEFMATQLRKLPRHTQQVLKLAACIGNTFDLKTLAIVYEKSEVDTAADLWEALIEGLVISANESYELNQYRIGSSEVETENKLDIANSQLPQYKFIHDRVQQAAYGLIAENKKQKIHLKIGQLLLQNTPIEERNAIIFALVNQLNMAVELIISGGDLYIQPYELACMNLTAGRRALVSTAYRAAFNYLNTGIKLLADDSWEQEYKLTLSLYETAAEAAYLAGKFEQTEELIEVVLKGAKTLVEKVKVYEIRIQAYGAQNKGLEAVNVGLKVLNLLGIDFPENPSQSDFEKAMAETTSNLAHRNIEDLLDLPQMTDVDSLAGMSILSNIMTFAYQVIPELMPLICCKQINLSLKYGNAPFSAFVYVVYGFILIELLQDIDLGYKFGTLSLNLVDKLNIKDTKAKVLETFQCLIGHRKQHIREILKPLLEAYSTGLTTGDLEFAAYSLNSYSYSSYFIGQELQSLQKEVEEYSNAISRIKQERIFNYNEIYRQAILNLLGLADNSFCLIGEAYDEKKMIQFHLQANDASGLVYLYFNKLFLCYLFEDFPQAIKNSSLAEQYLDGVRGQLVVPVFYFYDSLTRLAIYSNVSESEQQQILEKVQANQEKMRHWANYAPMNYLHKYYLVEAEKYRVLDNKLEAIELYDRAISLAQENEYIQEQALAQELTAKFYLEWNKQKIAQTYLTDAYYGYSRWGAKSKVDYLTNCYPQLLAPILQSENLSPIPSETSTFANHISTNSKTLLDSSNTSISHFLDLAAAMKASQAISGEIEIEQLLSTLIKVVMENAGASKSALVLSTGEKLTLTAICYSLNSDSTYTDLPSIPLESSDDVPINLINYVKRTLEIFVSDNVQIEESLVNDSYIIHQQPKSLLCMPILNQGKLIGILYLENNLTLGAFTRDRLELLKMITTQAAISLENAILYKNLTTAKEQLEEYSHSLEEKVFQRTQQLNEKNISLKQALEKLQNTQTQLIQTEKMSSLGQMVAGIAHEINNPINFIHGNINYANQYIQDLLNLIAVYQEEYQTPSSKVEEIIEEIDLDFLTQDLQKLLESMKVGSSRIRAIVLGLRNFSRLDESDMKLADIHEGIDNTLMILQHRLKAKSDCPAIEVIKEYGNIPEVNCYAGQLNQVFMNIISNAIDALEEIRIQDSSTPNLQIRIHTQITDSNHIKISIADNGSGIPEGVQQKIFDPFFTTKAVGSGTGLGLAISYQIVVDKHKGQLICNSVPGEGTKFVIEIPVSCSI